MLKEGNAAEIGGNRFFFTATPGHASHHSAIIFPELNFMATGDMLIPTSVPYVLHSPQAYLDSLKNLHMQVREHHIDKSAPGHANFFHSHSAITEKIKIEQTYLEQLINNGIELHQAGFTGERFQAELERKIPVEKNNFQHRQNIKILQRELALSDSDEFN